MTWSATITDTAIVMSAWRRSWPWFQRSRSCWTASPNTAMHAIATSHGTTHSSVFTSCPDRKNPEPVIRCCTSYAM